MSSHHLPWSRDDLESVVPGPVVEPADPLKALEPPDRKAPAGTAARKRGFTEARGAARDRDSIPGRGAKRERRSPRERVDVRQARENKAVADDPGAVAREVVLRQLTMGPRTRAQLQKAMARKEIPEEVVTAVLDRFEEVDLVDDEEFARQWVQSRHLGRGLARRALAYELRQRGVADETVKNAVDEVSPDDELSAARELVRRKVATMRNDDPQRRVRRLAGMLARKGYGGGLAMQAIREELAEFDLPDPEDDDIL
jgi:regulatory protein